MKKYPSSSIWLRFDSLSHLIQVARSANQRDLVRDSSSESDEMAADSMQVTQDDFDDNPNSDNENSQNDLDPDNVPSSTESSQNNGSGQSSQAECDGNARNNQVSSEY